MSPIATDTDSSASSVPTNDIAELKAKLQEANLDHGSLILPPDNGLRLQTTPSGSTMGRTSSCPRCPPQGYLYFPLKPVFVQDVTKMRQEVRDGKPYVYPATRADPVKKALFNAAKEVKDLATHIGTEISSLTNTQRDEPALLMAERHVVFFRNQDLSVQAQKELHVYVGDRAIETHVQAPQVRGVGRGLTLIWEDGRGDEIGKGGSWRVPYGGGQFGWHTDLVHEAYPPGYAHLHQDTMPAVAPWHWTPGTSPIWDNRSIIHTVSYNYEGKRHWTRVSSLADKQFSDPKSRSKAKALNQSKWLQSPYINRY
ncbi:hypothetical protein CspeluHIS016_0403610 [Cutaneotrichosporon spelunceum]|uniref:TauD/TfdA-like domain-containing protein n=1 Tax=Cutaneotrichosporon spelunceum TaxID=1672016 RepID=A0AAD3TV93_9TREE|nr:hypothetical protein CspeluHIS016_0403610 [Cutaneotrichosporon spelunceum]